jgi:hypothetical protein
MHWNRSIAFGPTGGGGGGGGNTAPLKYPDDGARRMPVANSLQAIEAGRKQRAAVIQRSGRASTRLAGSPGTAPYVNTSIGGTQ